MPISNPSRSITLPELNVTLPRTVSTAYTQNIKNVTIETTQEIAPANQNRLSLTIFNKGENTALIDVSAFLTNETGYMFKLESGSFYESTCAYTGSFYAVADGQNDNTNAVLEVRQFLVY